MQFPRISVASLMVVIMIVAVNCAVIRAFRYHHSPEAEVMPVWFASQFGLYRMAHTRGRARVFWAGFGGSCLVTCLTLLSQGSVTCLVRLSL
jgi:hypothetical protein